MSVLLFLRALMVTGWVRLRGSLQRSLRRRFRRVHQYTRKENWREAGQEVLALLQWVLEEITGELSDQPLTQQIQRVPPSLKGPLTRPLQEGVPLFETIGFAQKEVMEQVDKKNVLEKIKNLEKVLYTALKKYK